MWYAQEDWTKDDRERIIASARESKRRKYSPQKKSSPFWDKSSPKNDWDRHEDQEKWLKKRRGRVSKRET